MTGQELRRRRSAAGIAGRLLCAKARIDRSRLSDLERGYSVASGEELRRLEEVLAELIDAREKVAKVAASVGWPLN